MMGLPSSELQKVRTVLAERAKREAVDVWPEHWHAVTLFLGMQTQWTSHGGLNYAVLPVVERRLPALPPALRQPRDVLFAQLRVIERAVLETWAEQAH